MFPKPAPNEPKARKPLKRSRVVTRRTKARAGRLKGAEMSTLRQGSWEERGALCFYCHLPCSEVLGELAHIRGKRMWGDTKENTAPAHKECHRKFHAYGPSGLKPCKKKEEAMARIHIVRIENQDDMAGVARPGEPYPRPFVTLKDGRTMTFKEWTDAKQPA